MITGIHHVTAIAGDPQRNLDFYGETLGLRLVKQTVNYDDPDTYHLYFGDRTGGPGTILTFFPWPGSRRGSKGVGQATSVGLSVPERALPFWRSRLEDEGILAADIETRFGKAVLPLYDPDGLQIDLIADASSESKPGWDRADIPSAAAVRGLHGVTLRERDAEATGSFLTSVLGFETADEGSNRRRYRIPGEGAGRWVDVTSDPEGSRGSIRSGSIHHVAWRVADDEAQSRWHRRLVGDGQSVSPVMDRQYFRSIYFREPGGVLFEIATDQPGFLVDEDLDSLGRSLRLPPWLEGSRQRIESRLPTLETGPRMQEKPV